MDEKFLNIISDVLEIDPGCLKREATAETIPQWDSLTHWTVIGELEDAYGIEFTMDEATEFKNLGEIYDTLKRKLG